MTDIAERLRKWTISPAAVPCGDLMDEAADEIARLRSQLLAAYQLGIRHCDPPDLRSGAVESREAVQLTDAERSAIADAADRYADVTPESAETANTLRGLLSRTGTNLRQTSDNATECRSQGEKLPERDRLTDEEREAINMSRQILVSDPSMNPAQRAEWAITLSRLLDRTGFAQ